MLTVAKLGLGGEGHASPPALLLRCFDYRVESGDKRLKRAEPDQREKRSISVLLIPVTPRGPGEALGGSPG